MISGQKSGTEWSDLMLGTGVDFDDVVTFDRDYGRKRPALQYPHLCSTVPQEYPVTEQPNRGRSLMRKAPQVAGATKRRGHFTVKSVYF